MEKVLIKFLIVAIIIIIIIIIFAQIEFHCNIIEVYICVKFTPENLNPSPCIPCPLKPN